MHVGLQTLLGAPPGSHARRRQRSCAPGHVSCSSWDQEVTMYYGLGGILLLIVLILILTGRL